MQQNCIETLHLFIVIIYLLRRSSRTAPEHKRQAYNTLKKKAIDRNKIKKVNWGFSYCIPR